MAFVAFRLDSGERIGSGHLMRCLTLANELRGRGAAVEFLVRGHPGELSARLVSQGHAVVRLPVSHADPPPAGTSGPGLGDTVESDVAQWRRQLERRRPDWLVTDHYSIDASWERGLRPAAERILVVDDLANRRHDCDVLVDQNWFGAATEGRYQGLVPPTCLELLGPRYALLQPDYTHVQPRSGGGGPQRRVFVFFGASDPTNETGKVLDALTAPEFADTAADVVLGAHHPRRAEIESRRRENPRITVHESVDSLAGLLASADLAIGAGGATTWERLCLNVPSIVVTVAPNQEPLTEALARDGYVTWIGSSAETTARTYQRALSSAPAKPPDLPRLVDGLGARRVAEAMLPSPEAELTLRRAGEDDLVAFFAWRNDASTRAMSFGSDPIDWPTHVQWYRRRLADSDTELFVLEARGLPVGQVRLDHGREGADLSYSMDAVARGRGWGRWMIAEALRRSPRARLRGVRARVKMENEASKKVFLRLGWTPGSDGEGMIVFRLPGAADQHLG
jgi:UDP-2,4-diacetamido-2,4,6-trideoxy-beta-L-altropyranose hydrolase